MPGADHRRQKSKHSKRSASGSNKKKTIDPARANSPKDNTSELDDEIQAEYVKVAAAAADTPTSTPEHEAQDEKTALTESDAPPAPPPHQQEFLDDQSFQREINRYNSPEFEDYLNKVAKHYPDVLRYIDLLQRIQRQQVEELEVAKHKLQTDLHKYKESYKRQHQELQRYQDHYRHQQQHGVDCGHGRKELAHDYDKDRQAHELAQLKIKLENLQTHALSSVDTFQPMPDSEIVNCLKGVGLKVEGVVKAVSNMKSSLSDDAWKVTLPQLMWQNTVNAEGPQFEYENKGIRRKALRNVVWWFVKDGVVGKPLKAFDGVVSANVNLIYRDLYPEPHQDPESANWRSMTATSLNRMVTEENDKTLLGEIQTGLSALLETLGYHPEAPEFQKKSKDLVDGALKLARILAQQRAIFKLFVPMPEGGGQIPKMEDDELMTSVERDGDDEEAGVVWFVSRPGFTKWGTGTGDDLDKPMHLEKALVELM